MSWIAAAVLGLTLCSSTTAAERPWTLLVYGAADNNADGPMLEFLDDVRKAIDDDPGIELVLFVDRHTEYSNDAKLLGEDFTGARLYRLRKDSAERLGGGAEMPEIELEGDVELDSADPHVLGRFIAFGKARFPAQRYGLLVYSHADGISMCPDEESGRGMGISAVTQAIDAKHSVDFLGLELCNMGGVEIAYQWRPGTGRFGADVLLAIPNAGPPLDWARSFARIRSEGHATKAAEPILRPATMTAKDFGCLVVDEGRRGREAAGGERGSHEAAACYDLKAVERVKQKVDALAVALSKTDSKRAFLAARETSESDRAITYDQGGPFIDLWDLCRRASESTALDDASRRAARDVMEATDAFVLASFGMSGYPGFEAGKSGAFVVLPADGVAASGAPRWKRFAWYSPGAKDTKQNGSGAWAFLADGVTPGNGVVEGWYELLDSWFDPDPKGTGGFNGYRW